MIAPNSLADKTAGATVDGGTPDLIGQPIDRVDGPLKVAGSAKYAAEFPQTNLAHAVLFTSTIAKGRAKSIDDSAAKSAPGVLTIITHTDYPKPASQPAPAGRGGPFNFRMPGILQSSDIHFAGQYLGVVVAETLEQARQAASLIKIDYEVQQANVDAKNPTPVPAPTGGMFGRGPGVYTRGDPDAALAAAPFRVDATYITPAETHACMEPHATIAAWDGGKLTLYDATQNVYGVRGAAAGVFGIKPDDVHVICPYLGGGFGTKGSSWPHTFLAAIAAKEVGRPVKLVVTRQQMFAQTGHRPVTIQKMSLAADHNGKLLAITHDSTSLTSEQDFWIEGTTGSTPWLYSCPAIRTAMHVARINSGRPCQMRGPGETPGSFGMESGIDEIAYAAGIDPLEFRLRNYSDRDEQQNKPYSSKALRECYQSGAERFGWSKRNPKPRSMTEGNLLIGWGMATATYGSGRQPCTASVRLAPNGSVLVSTAAHDIGTGTYTILTQIAAEELGLPIDRVRTQMGDTSLPRAPGAGGSQTAASAGCAVQAVSKKLVAEIAKLSVADTSSPLHGLDVDRVIAREGRLVSRDNPSVSEPLTAVFSRNGGQAITALGDGGQDPHANDYSRHAWGAQFAEVAVDPLFGQVRVRRFVGRFAGGTILNQKTATSQVMGAVVMGIGMALFEQINYDLHQGTIVNDNLADYLVPVNADIPAIDCGFVEEKDEFVNPLGAKGVGELGIAGAAAAIANAVFHATGKRMRELPITCEKVMDA